MDYWKGIIHHYREYLPVNENTPIITLYEGNTPLVHAQNLAREIGFKGEIFLKYEGLNPTGSFKDRGMTLAISKAVEAGKTGGYMCVYGEHLRFCRCVRCKGWS
jgi:L-threonine synthase (EC 4.2.3.1)